MGYTIKLLAIAAEDDGQVEVRVHPAFLPSHALLARVDGVFNAVQVQGDLAGKVMFTGRGAGAHPTASAIIADVIDIAQDIQREMGFITPVIHYDDSKSVRPMADVNTRYFIRMEVADEPGVLAQVASVIGQERVSIASIVQKEVNDAARSAEIVIITHTAREASVDQALGRLRDLPAVHEIGSTIRIEEED
jgi:homoserine dehydrogenase